MRISSLFTAFVIMFGFTFLAVSDRAEALDITKIIQGTVKEKNDDFIRIADGPNGKVDQVVIDSNTVYDNVQELADLKAGDTVQIDYKIKYNKKTAITITKIEVVNDDSV